MNTKEQPSEIMSQTPKQYHNTQRLIITSSTNKISCLKYQRRQKKSPHTKNPTQQRSTREKQMLPVSLRFVLFQNTFILHALGNT